MTDDPDWCYVRGEASNGDTLYSVLHPKDGMAVGTKGTHTPLLVDATHEIRITNALGLMKANNAKNIRIVYLNPIENPVADELEDRTVMVQRIAIKNLSETEIEALGLKTQQIAAIIRKP